MENDRRSFIKKLCLALAIPYTNFDVSTLAFTTQEDEILKEISRELWANISYDYYKKNNSTEYLVYLHYINQRYKRIGGTNELPSVQAVFGSVNGIRNTYRASQNPQVLFSNLSTTGQLLVDVIGKVPYGTDAMNSVKYYYYFQQSSAFMDYISIQSRYDLPIRKYKNIFSSQNVAYLNKNANEILKETGEIAQHDPEYSKLLATFHSDIGFSIMPNNSPFKYIKEQPTIDSNGLVSKAILSIQENSKGEGGSANEVQLEIKDTFVLLEKNLIDELQGIQNTVAQKDINRLSLQEKIDGLQVGLNSSVAILSLLDKKAAQRLNIMGSSGLEIFKLLNNPYNWSSTFVAFGVAGIGIQAVNSYMASSQPTESTVILNFLQQFAEAVFKRLDVIETKIDYVLKALEKLYNDVMKEITELGYEVQRISLHLVSFEANVRSYFEDLNRKERFLLEIECFVPDAILVNRKLTLSEFENCLRQLHRVATIDSVSSLATGGVSRNYAHEEYQTEFKKFPVAYNLTYLKELLKTHTSLSVFEGVIGNPLQWIYAAKGYMHIIANHPEFTEQINVNSLDTISTNGLKISAFIKSINLNIIEEIINKIPKLKGHTILDELENIEISEINKRGSFSKNVTPSDIIFPTSSAEFLTKPRSPLVLGNGFMFPLSANGESTINVPGTSSATLPKVAWFLRNYTLLADMGPSPANYRAGIMFSGSQKVFFGCRPFTGNLGYHVSPTNEIISIGFYTMVPGGDFKFEFPRKDMEQEFLEYEEEVILNMAETLIDDIKMLVMQTQAFIALELQSRSMFLFLKEVLLVAYSDVIYKDKELYDLLSIDSPLLEAMKKYNATPGNPLKSFVLENDGYIEHLLGRIKTVLSESNKTDPKHLGSQLIEDTLASLGLAKKSIQLKQPLDTCYRLELNID
jgi:hypothetical protein